MAVPVCGLIGVTIPCAGCDTTWYVMGFEPTVAESAISSKGVAAETVWLFATGGTYPGTLNATVATEESE